MEQLTNMPVWGQILSMGSFMFASGVLMTRIPLAPVIILSFFYLYGAFGNFTTMPTFTLKHPWIWTVLHLFLLVLLAFLWIRFNHALSKAHGPDAMGLGFAGVWLIILTGSVVGITILISTFPALFKWGQLLLAISRSPWQIILWSALFTGGILIGIFSLGVMKSLHNLSGAPMYMAFTQFRFISPTFIALLICACSLAGITFGMDNLNGILACSVSVLCSISLISVLISVGMLHAKYAHLHSDFQQPLLRAAENGDLEQTKKLLAQGRSVNARDNLQRTPLLNAIHNGHLEVVQELIQNGADVNAADKFGMTPLSSAAAGGDIAIVRELIRAGADVNVGCDGAAPLIRALSKGAFDVATALIQAGADVNIKAHYPYRTALAEASWRRNSAEFVKLLLQKGANVNAVDFNGKTALQLILGREQNVDVAHLIYAAGGRLGKISSEDQIGPMMDAACSFGFTEVVKQLLQAGIKPTPHHAILAAQAGQTEMLKQLLAAGLDINQPDEQGKHPFLYAVSFGHLETVQFFVEHGADLTVEESGQGSGTVGPALVLASLTGNLPIVKYLIEQKTDVNITNRFGTTPLQIASRTGHMEIVRFLLQSGATINQQNNNQSTSLNLASENGHVKIVQELLKAGADVNLEDKAKDSPLSNAAREGHTEVIRLLIEAKANVNSKNNDGKTPLVLAKEKGHAEAVKLLKSYGAKE